MNLPDRAQFMDTISRFLHRYHIVLFALVVVGSLSFATFLLSSAMSPPATSITTNSGTPSKLDTDTMRRVDTLNNGSTPLTLPSNTRTNPFTN